MTCRLLNINLLANIRSPVLSFQATKFTAPTFRQHSRKKYGLDRKRNTFNKQPKRMDTAKFQVEIMMAKNREIQEADNNEDLFKFKNIPTTLEAQMQSIRHKGFLRAYQSYEPPSNVEEKFFSSVGKILENISNEQESMKSTPLDDLDLKLQVLNALSSEFSHKVPNSLLHEMKTVADLLVFYQSPISTLTPYEQLHEEMMDGKLPANLVIQADAVRFTGEGDHPLNTVTAFPRRNTVISSIYSRDNKYVPVSKPSRHQEEDYN